MNRIKYNLMVRRKIDVEVNLIRLPQIDFAANNIMFRKINQLQFRIDLRRLPQVYLAEKD